MSLEDHDNIREVLAKCRPTPPYTGELIFRRRGSDDVVIVGLPAASSRKPMNPRRAGSSKTPSIEIRVYSMIFRIFPRCHQTFGVKTRHRLGGGHFSIEDEWTLRVLPPLGVTMRSVFGTTRPDLNVRDGAK
jgi:hypothetical protein